MTTLRTNKPRALQNNTTNGLPVLAGARIYEGAAVGMSAGYARPLVSGDQFAGFAKTKVTGTKSQQVVIVDAVGKAELAVSGVTAESLGVDVFATDDDTFALSRRGTCIGTVWRVISPGVAVVAFRGLGVGLDAVQTASVAAGLGTRRNNVVLIGDSMTDWYNGSGVTQTLNSAVYTAATGILELTFATAASMYDGAPAYVWSNIAAYTGLLDQIPTTCVRVSPTVWRLNIGANLAGVPAATDIKTGLSPRIDVGRAANSFVNWCQMLTGWRMRVVRNAAQSGARSSSLLRRLDRDVLAYMPALCIGQAMGINDIGDPSPRTEGAINADRQEIYDAIIAAGGVICEGSITPVGAGEASRATLNHMQSVLRMNDWSQNYAIKHGAPFSTVDHYATFVDPTNATGLALASAVRSTPDFIHPSMKSGIALGRQWAARIDDLVPWSDSTLPRSVIDCQAGSYLTITSCSSTNDVVTVNATNHRYQVGDDFFVNAASARTANGRWLVETASANAFTFTVPGLGNVGSITGRQISRSRNIWSNPLFTTTSGGTNNMTAAGITGTVPGNCSLGGTPFGAGTWVGTTGTRAAVDVTGSLLQQAPVGNEWYVDVTTAPVATSSIDFSSAGTSTFGINAGGSQIMLPGRSYIFEGVLCLRSTSWTVTKIKNMLAQFSVGDDLGWAMTAPAFSAADAAETDIITADTRIHFRTTIFKTTVLPGAVLNAASFLVRVNLDGAGFTGQTLTVAVQQFDLRDVTGDEADYL